jgi:site-specific DNA-methyltransferase (adenine-specific)
MSTKINIINGSCIDSQKRIADNSIDLMICDPPFGLGESKFDKHYNRDSSNIISGYQEAPEDYDEFTYSWMSEAKRVLKNDGSMYIIIGHTNLRSILNSAHSLGLNLINHIIWKYNFGVNTKKKYVTSHYHVLYFSKSKKANTTFNANCRFGFQEKDKKGGSLLYQDLEDVWVINKEYSPKQKKNQNKLPEELIKKIILYSSNEGDTVCDFFMGNFTTAYCSLSLGRHVCGYEINKESYDFHMPEVAKVKYGSYLSELRVVKNIVPLNQGKRITSKEVDSIMEDFRHLTSQGMKKKDISLILQEKYSRGRFAIQNILSKRENL